MTNSVDFDVIIVGAGPAGIICAMQLAKKGFDIAIIEKETFPRDKTCGDALSLDVYNQFHLIDPKLAERFTNFAKKIPSHGVSIIAPSQESFDIPLFYKGEKKHGYIAKRKDFDYFLFKELKEYINITIIENCKIIDITVSNDIVTCKAKDKKIYFSKIIIGADGAHSIVDKKLINNRLNHSSYSAGLRVYYENVTGFNDDNYIELHFFKEILPGYLWIFPLPNNQANVGIGMLSKYVSKKKVNLKEVLARLIETHPSLKERFKNAKPLEKIQGFGLPLGNPKRKISGNRFILLGDAAGLIDPFSGEGIGNAIRSGRVGAMHIETCINENDFSETKNKAYDKEIYRRMGTEFKVSKGLQKLCRHPKIFNAIVRKANKNETLKSFLIGTMEDVEKKRILLKPSFYYQLLFK